MAEGAWDQGFLKVFDLRRMTLHDVGCLLSPPPFSFPLSLPSYLHFEGGVGFFCFVFCQFGNTTTSGARTEKLTVTNH